MGENVSISHFASYRNFLKAKLAHPSCAVPSLHTLFDCLAGYKIKTVKGRDGKIRGHIAHVTIHQRNKEPLKKIVRGRNIRGHLVTSSPWRVVARRPRLRVFIRENVPQLSLSGFVWVSADEAEGHLGGHSGLHSYWSVTVCWTMSQVYSVYIISFNCRKVCVENTLVSPVTRRWSQLQVEDCLVTGVATYRNSVL
jgi:hypothetical protein